MRVGFNPLLAIQKALVVKFDQILDREAVEQGLKLLLEASTKEELEISLWKIRGSKSEVGRSDEGDWDYLLRWMRKNCVVVRNHSGASAALLNKGAKYFGKDAPSNSSAFTSYVTKSLRFRESENVEVWKEVIFDEPDHLLYALHDPSVAKLLLSHYPSELAKHVLLEKVHSPLLRIQIFAVNENADPDAVESLVDELDLENLRTRQIKSVVFPPSNIDQFLAEVAQAKSYFLLESIPTELYAAATPNKTALQFLYTFLPLRAKRIVTPLMKDLAFNEKSNPRDLIFLPRGLRTRVIHRHIRTWTATLKKEIASASGVIRQQTATVKGRQFLASVLSEPNGSLDSLLIKADCFGYLDETVKVIQLGLVAAPIREQVPIENEENIDLITLDPLTDPVTLPSKNVVNRSTMEKLDVDPFTNTPLPKEWKKQYQFLTE